MTLEESGRLTLRHELIRQPHKHQGVPVLEEGYVEIRETSFFPTICLSLPPQMQAEIAKMKFIC